MQSSLLRLNAPSDLYVVRSLVKDYRIVYGLVLLLQKKPNNYPILNNIVSVLQLQGSIFNIDIITYESSEAIVSNLSQFSQN